MDELSRTFSALADPTRRAILARLAQGVATVKELSEPFSISAPAISKHLRVLEGAGLISRGRDAQWRPCRLEPEPLRAVAEWTDAYRRFWEESFDRLDAYLEELQASAPAPPLASPPATPRPVERSAKRPTTDRLRPRGGRSLETKASATRGTTRQRKPQRGPRR